MQNEAYICCFTGHRNICGEHVSRLADVLGRTVDNLISAGVTVFRTGGAVGFDTVAALTVIEKKKTNGDIRLQLMLPCKNQTDRWSEKIVRAYEYVKQNADEVIYTADRYYKGCMLYRDRRLVDGADFCVAYCMRSHGGTAYTLNYAKQSGLKTVNIALLL